MGFSKFSSILGIILTVVFWLSSASAGLLSGPGASDLPYRIKADSLGYDDALKTYKAKGNVTITMGDESLEADAVELNEETREAEAWGNVRYFSGEDWLTGSHLEMDMDKGTGTMYHGSLFIEESNISVPGEEM